MEKLLMNSKSTKITFVCISTKQSPSDTLLGCSYYKLYENNPNFELLFIGENTNESLSALYNRCIDTIESDFIIFIHDDISVEDNNLQEKIFKAIGDDSIYSVCGLAGNFECNIKDKNLWHLMGSRETLSGAVAHYTGKDDTECFMTNFGPTPRRCILLDGLFMAINLKEIRDSGVRFDEENPAKWNFYDLNFCLDCNKLGLKMTTYPIWVVHKSHGLSDINQPDWNKGNDYFKKKWSK